MELRLTSESRVHHREAMPAQRHLALLPRRQGLRDDTDGWMPGHAVIGHVHRAGRRRPYRDDENHLCTPSGVGDLIILLSSAARPDLSQRKARPRHKAAPSEW